MPAFDSEPGQVGNDFGDRKRIVVVIATGTSVDQAELLEFAQLLQPQAGRVQKLVQTQPQGRRRRAKVLRGRRVVGDCQMCRSGHSPACMVSAVNRFKLILDHPQGQIVITLLAEYVLEPRHVRAGELAIARRCPVRLYQALILEKADLGDGDVRKIVTQVSEHLADREGPPGRQVGGAHVAAPDAVKYTSRNLPICTSSPPDSTAESIRSRLT